MKEHEAVEQSTKLIEGSNFAFLGSVDQDGFPNIKAMIKMEHDGLRTIWFSTNVSSKRVAQFKANSKACVYFVDMNQWSGLMLKGEITILMDAETKAKFWRDGFEKYYREGITDPDYCVLRFNAHVGNYYRGLKNLTFEVR